MVRAQNQKKKKSGGFQSMGACEAEDNCPWDRDCLSPPAHAPSLTPVPLGLSYPVFKGIMKKGYKVPTPIQRKVSMGSGGSLPQGVAVGQ